MPLKRRFAGFLVFCLFSLTLNPSLYASRPYRTTDSAVPVDHGKTRLELGLQNDNFDGDRDHIVVLGELTYGVINNLDFEVEFPYRFLRVDGGKDEDGLGDVRLKSRVRIIKGREANPLSIAGQVVVKIPSCDEDKRLSPECTGEPDVGLIAIASKEFFPITVDVNLGWVFVGNPPGSTLDDILQYSLAFDIQTVHDALRFVSELSGNSNRKPDAGNHVLSILGGLIYSISVNLLVDVALSVGLTEETSDYGLTFGFSYFL